MSSINLSRNTRLWVSTVTSGHSNANTFEIPIQDGYSMTQGTTSTDVMLEEAGPTPTRGARRFNDSLDPVDWSFTTYITPYIAGGKTYLVDGIMWQGLAVSNAEAVDFDDTDNEVHATANKFTVGFGKNSAHVLRRLYLYFQIDNQMFLVSGAQVGSAEVSADISDIAQVSWSGQALEFTRIPTPAFVSANGLAYDPASVETDTYVAVPANKRYIVNKLTIMDLNSDVAPGNDDYYDIPITGGSVTIENNITYLTPNTLAEVDKPIGSFAGSFMVSGSIDAYLRQRNGDGTSGNPYGSAELMDHMLTAGVQGVTNAANLVLNLGGKQAGEPSVAITIPSAHLSVPEFEVGDVVSSSMEFMGVTTDPQMVSGQEIFIDAYAER